MDIDSGFCLGNPIALRVVHEVFLSNITLVKSHIDGGKNIPNLGGYITKAIKENWSNSHSHSNSDTPATDEKTECKKSGPKESSEDVNKKLLDNVELEYKSYCRDYVTSHLHNIASSNTENKELNALFNSISLGTTRFPKLKTINELIEYYFSNEDEALCRVFFGVLFKQTPVDMDIASFAEHKLSMKIRGESGSLVFDDWLI